MLVPYDYHPCRNHCRAHISSLFYVPAPCVNPAYVGLERPSFHAACISRRKSLVVIHRTFSVGNIQVNVINLVLITFLAVAITRSRLWWGRWSRLRWRGCYRRDRWGFSFGLWRELGRRIQLGCFWRVSRCRPARWGERICSRDWSLACRCTLVLLFVMTYKTLLGRKSLVAHITSWNSWKTAII